MNEHLIIPAVFLFLSATMVLFFGIGPGRCRKCGRIALKHNHNILDENEKIITKTRILCACGNDEII